MPAPLCDNPVQNRTKISIRHTTEAVTKRLSGLALFVDSFKVSTPACFPRREDTVKLSEKAVSLLVQFSFVFMQRVGLIQVPRPFLPWKLDRIYLQPQMPDYSRKSPTYASAAIVREPVVYRGVIFHAVSTEHPTPRPSYPPSTTHPSNAPPPPPARHFRIPHPAHPQEQHYFHPRHHALRNHPLHYMHVVLHIPRRSADRNTHDAAPATSRTAALPVLVIRVRNTDGSPIKPVVV